MIREGQVVLFRFPQTDQSTGKLRPALILRKTPGAHDDWLLCMISTQLAQTLPRFDEVVRASDADFAATGLNQDSLIRVCRLAVVHKTALRGAIGEIAPARLERIQTRLADWIRGA